MAFTYEEHRRCTIITAKVVYDNGVLPKCYGNKIFYDRNGKKNHVLKIRFHIGPSLSI